MLKNKVFVVFVIISLKICNVVSFVDNFSQLKAANISTNNESDKECKNQLNFFIEELEKRESWAVESE
jgi:hypothetical protein